MGTSGTRSLRRTQEGDYLGTSTGTTDGDRQVSGGNRRLGLRNRSGSITTTGWKVETSRIPIKNHDLSRTELRNLRQGTASHCRSTQEMETIPDGHLSNLRSTD